MGHGAWDMGHGETEKRGNGETVRKRWQIASGNRRRSLKTEKTATNERRKKPTKNKR